MKLAAIAKLIKADGYCKLYKVFYDDCRTYDLYIGTKTAIFPLTGFPKAQNESELATLLGISKKEWADIEFDNDCPDDLHHIEGMDLDDTADGEMDCVTGRIGIRYCGGELVPMIEPVSGTVGFVDAKQIMPVADEIRKSGYFKYCARKMASGGRYYVIKDGMVVRGAVLPVKLEPLAKSGLRELADMVRCLLNAETLRNPCTNERKELAAKLEELHATVKYIPDAFKNARRAARVEVALVSVDIPDREPVSRIRLDLKNETAERLKENPEFAALVSSDPITAAIERYNAAAEGVRRIYEEYNGIKSLFSSAGAGKKESPVMAFTKSYNDAIRELRGMYWKQLFEMPQLFDAMTYEMQQDYQKRIKELEGYDFSAYNILTVREEISRNLLSSIDHEIIKLFDDWTNLHYNDEYSKNVHYYNGWCTNSAYKINRKVIFRCNAFDTYDGRFCPRYNATGHVAQIERVLHFLDTNGKPYNGDELRAVLDAAEKSGQTQKIQLHYFTATFYKKGTCHIEFTNTDVLKSFNLYAGQRKGWLPPTYGKKSYHDMAAADRRVVDSYEGEASYTDTLTRHLIPTQSTFLQLNA